MGRDRNIVYSTALQIGIETALLTIPLIFHEIRNENYRKIIEISRVLKNVEREKRDVAISECENSINVIESEIINLDKIINEFKKGIKLFIEKKNLLDQNYKNKELLIKIKKSIDVLSRKYNEHEVEGYRKIIFQEELKKWKWSLITTPTSQKVEAPFFLNDDFFKKDTFPIKNEIFDARIIKRFDEYLIHLNYNIEGKLILPEKIDTENINKTISVFIEKINYRERLALLSIKRAEFIREIENSTDSFFQAKVSKINKFGTYLVINDFECFMPRRYERSKYRPKINSFLNVRFFNDRYLKGDFVVKTSDS